MLGQRTTIEARETAKRGWVLVDVENQVVGRVASRIANMLRGKDLPAFTPHVDAGQFVVVVNAAKVKFTGNKLKEKKYYRHSGFPGGMKEITAEAQLAKHPERVLRDAVWGMLPKNRLSRHLIRKLKIYPGEDHPHVAQGPAAQGPVIQAPAPVGKAI